MLVNLGGERGGDVFEMAVVFSFQMRDCRREFTQRGLVGRCPLKTGTLPCIRTLFYTLGTSHVCTMYGVCRMSALEYCRYVYKYVVPLPRWLIGGHAELRLFFLVRFSLDAMDERSFRSVRSSFRLALHGLVEDRGRA